MIHVVDDNIAFAGLLTEVISGLDEKCLTFHSAVEYLEFMSAAEYEPPMAIFTDVNMPEINGYELIEKVLAIYPEQKFVVVSGAPEFNHAAKAHACIYLSKPFNFAVIQDVIRSLRKCNSDGYSSDNGCMDVCDRSLFALESWSCPHQQCV